MGLPPDFDPNAIGVKNGAFFGLDTPVEQAEIVFQSVPWDITTSYRPGTRNGPELILDCSTQVDLYSRDVEKPWLMKLGTIPVPQGMLEESARLRAETEKYIEFLEQGGEIKDSPEHLKNLTRFNQECASVHQAIREQTAKQLKAGRAVITVGGDHSCAEGPIQAYAEKFPNLSILHIDAHADLRVAYEGFTYSHASIMDRVLETTSVKKLVQLGIRDVSPGEVERTQQDPRIRTFFDWDLKDHLQNGNSYRAFMDQIISELTSDVYVSFDIDGLDPKLCPSTGTPVPGGLEFEQATALIRAITKSGRRIVGADLLEVAPGENDDWDGNVGARILYALTLAVYQGLKT